MAVWGRAHRMARKDCLPPLCNYATSRRTVPVVVKEAFPTGLDEAIVGVPTGWLAMRHVGDERAALLQAGQHTGHAFGAFQLSVVGLDDILFAHAFGWGWRCCLDGNAQLVGDAPHPGLVGVGALLEHGRLDAGDADDVVEEVDQVLWPLQPLDIAIQDNAIPARVDELDSAAQ